jgi:RNA polymerase sigma-70 factor (ECF subfamily)
MSPRASHDEACDDSFASIATSVARRVTLREQAAEEGQASEPADLRALFDAHYASIWRLLQRLGVHPAQLDDAAQEVFWVAARRLRDIEPGREHAFLYGVALRVASTETRQQREAPPLADFNDVHGLADSRPSPEEHLERRRARELLDLVPLELRAVFVLFELEEVELRDIAVLQEIPLGTASSRLRRAREEFSAIAKRMRALWIQRGGSL